jgi:hypothetical protein
MWNGPTRRSAVSISPSPCELLSPQVPAYRELNLRLRRWPASRWSLSVNGPNLLHGRHEEHSVGDAIGRAALGGVRYRCVYAGVAKIAHAHPQKALPNQTSRQQRTNAAHPSYSSFGSPGIEKRNGVGQPAASPIGPVATAART